MRVRLLASLAFLAAVTATSSARAQTKQASTLVSCTDGTTSKSGRGACSGHGGIKAAASPAAKPVALAGAATTQPAAKASAIKAPTANASVAKAPAAKAPAAKAAVAKGGNDDATDATAQCKDGTYSHAKTHQGACSKHDGVSKFLK